MAPGAKLSFVDLGKPGTGLCVPKAGVLYGPGYRAGSRVGSNSWGGYYSGPGYYSSQDTDGYLHKKMVRTLTTLNTHSLAVGCKVQ